MLSEHAERILSDRAPDLIDELVEAVRIRSVSSEAHADLDVMAEWVSRRLAPLLDDVQRVPVDGAADAVIGRASGHGTETILLYSHYDVQPASPEAEWTYDPFAGEIADGRVYGRGVVDDKADILARIHALEIWRSLGRELPFDLVWLSEGAEEVGSPGLEDVVRRELADDGVTACVWESYLRTEDGQPELVFGCRGLVYVELTLEILRSDQHSSFASISRSATGEMARALASLTDDTGRCVIDTFLDGIEEPTPGDLALIDAASIPSLDVARLEDVDPYLTTSQRELRRRFALTPTCNIAGMTGGFTGEGLQTVVAGSAMAKIDFRIVPGQEPDAVVAALRRHLDDHGFTDIDLRVLAVEPPYRSPVDFPVADAVRRAARELMGEPTIRPIVPGTGPLHAVETLGAPIVLPPGAFRMSSMVHAPDENVRIDDYLDAVRLNLRLMEILADRG